MNMNELDKTSPIEEKVTTNAVSAEETVSPEEAVVALENEKEESASEVCAEIESSTVDITETDESPRICTTAESSDLSNTETAEQTMIQCDDESLECMKSSSQTVSITEADDSEEERQNSDFKMFHDMTKEELVNALKDILEASRFDAYREVNGIRKAFNEIREKETERELAEFIDEGNTPEDFSSTPSELDTEFLSLSTEFRQRRTEYVAAEEAKRLANLDKKKEIIKQILDLTEDIDNINLRFQEFRQLQVDFKEVKEIPQSEENEVWKHFQAAVEQFYDCLKVNKELRDLDFKKNLELKRQLVEEVKTLESEEDVVGALRKLQELREQWREVGPVAKELRDDIWKEFNASASVVFRRHQDYFEARKAIEQKAEEEKNRLCEEAESVLTREFNKGSDWETAAADLKILQGKWKEAGFASRKVNNLLFARFRTACDSFFNRRNEHYKEVREKYDQAIKAKEALIAKTIALADEPDTQKAVSETLKIQEEWKHAGIVPIKHKDILWKRFREACDVIFDRRKKETGAQRQEQMANLTAKKEIIAQLKEIPVDLDRKEGISRVRELQDKWNSIGFVPFKHKNAINDEYRAIVDALYDTFKMKEQKARMKNFSEQIESLSSDDSKLGRERDRLMRELDRKRQELKTYENNLGFFNVKSSAGSSMLKEMERRTRQIEEEIVTIKKKIEMVDDKRS